MMFIKVLHMSVAYDMISYIIKLLINNNTNLI